MATTSRVVLACAPAGGGSDEKRRIPCKRRALEDATNKERDVDDKKRMRKVIVSKPRRSSQVNTGKENKTKSVTINVPKTKTKAQLKIPIPARLPTPQRGLPLDLSKLSVAIDRLSPPCNVEDIDQQPNSLDSSPYAKDIFDYLMKKESTVHVSSNYLKNGSQINASMRSILCDWLIQVQDHLSIQEDTLHAAVNMIDRYLNQSDTPLAKLQLVGITCLLIAAKFNERYPPEISQLIHLTEDTYVRKQVLHMELVILGHLNFEIVTPGPLDFLPRFLRVINARKKTEQACRYLLDLCLTDLPCAHLSASEKAAGSLCLIRHIECDKLVHHALQHFHCCPPAPSRTSMQLRDSTLLNRKSLNHSHSTDDDDSDKEDDVWPHSLVFYTTYNVVQLRPIMMRFSKLLVRASSAKYQGAYNKHSSISRHNAISLWEPLQSSRVVEELASKLQDQTHSESH